MQSFPSVIDVSDAVAENGLRMAVKMRVYPAGQIAALQRDQPVAERRAKLRNVNRGDSGTVLIYDAELFYRIGAPTQFRHQPHSLRHVEPRAPEIDQIASLAQRWRLLH